MQWKLDIKPLFYDLFLLLVLLLYIDLAVKSGVECLPLPRLNPKVMTPFI